MFGIQLQFRRFPIIGYIGEGWSKYIDHNCHEVNLNICYRINIAALMKGV